MQDLARRQDLVSVHTEAAMLVPLLQKDPILSTFRERSLQEIETKIHPKVDGLYDHTHIRLCRSHYLDHLHTGFVTCAHSAYQPLHICNFKSLTTCTWEKALLIVATSMAEHFQREDQTRQIEEDSSGVVGTLQGLTALRVQQYIMNKVRFPGWRPEDRTRGAIELSVDAERLLTAPPEITEPEDEERPPESVDTGEGQRLLLAASENSEPEEEEEEERAPESADTGEGQRLLMSPPQDTELEAEERAPEPADTDEGWQLLNAPHEGLGPEEEERAPESADTGEDQQVLTAHPEDSEPEELEEEERAPESVETARGAEQGS